MIIPIAFPHAQASDSDALRYLASSSDVIAVASVTTPPDSWDGSSPIGPSPTSAPPPAAYSLDGVARVEIIKTLKGKYDSKTPLVTLRRPFASDAQDRPFDPPSYPKGAKYIMFLKDRRLHGDEFDRTSVGAETVNLVAFDPWLSCLPYSRSLELELEKVEK